VNIFKMSFAEPSQELLGHEKRSKRTMKGIDKLAL
jgi:hypothetical protein